MSTAIPAFEDLGEAPEKGDAVLMLASNFCIPVRNRERAWSIESIGGWSTTAETPAPLSFAPMGPTVNMRRPWEEPEPSNRCLPLPPPEEWDSPRFVFAHTAEAAIEKYHASEACPWGKLQLRRCFDRSEYFKFSSDPDDATLFVFNANGECKLAESRFWVVDFTIAYHALLTEVIAYQTAERAGTRDSRIHKAIEKAI